MNATPHRRTLIRAAAWTAPAVTAFAAAPAFAASGPARVTGTFATERRAGDVLQSGTVSSRGAKPVMVTVTLRVSVDAGIPDTVLSATEVNTNGWARAGYGFADETRKAVFWTGTRRLEAVETVPVPQLRYRLADSSYGISTMSIIVWPPATAVDPAPVPFSAFTAPVAP